jgi:hypothetical protein
MLQNVGDVVGPVTPGDRGLGNPPGQSAIISLTGTFTNAVVSIEALMPGQPTTPSTAPGGLPTPTNPNEWTPVASAGWTPMGNQNPVGLSPSSPLTSPGGPGSGFSFTLATTLIQQLRVRLLSIGSGSIKAAIACSPAPVS